MQPVFETSENGQRTSSRSPLRVAVVTETYPPEVNGVARTVARVVQGLTSRGHAVEVIRPKQSPTDQAKTETGRTELLTLGIPIPRYPGLKFGVPSTRLLFNRWQNHRPDIVHIATEGPLGWSALQAARRLNLPVVSEFRTNFHAYTKYYGIGWIEGLIRRYLRTFHNRTAMTMVPTRSLADQLARDGFERLEVVPRGVDVDVFHPWHRDETLRQRWGATQDSLVVLLVGRVAPEKNLHLAKVAFRAMQAVHVGAKLVVVGDGPARRALQTELPDAIFAGMQTGEQLSAHYASADLLLFPSRTETYGNVTTEAMASGLAVLAYNYAAAAELVQSGVSGWLAPLDDFGHFVEQATTAALDVHRVRHFGQSARNTVVGHSWETVLGQLESHYRTEIERPLRNARNSQPRESNQASPSSQVAPGKALEAPAKSGYAAVA